MASKCSTTFVLFVPLALLIAGVAWYYTGIPSESASATTSGTISLISETLLLWKKILFSGRIFEQKKFLIGTNVNLDLIVPFDQFIAGFENNVRHPKPSSNDILSNADEFFATMMYYFERGAAAERFVADSELFQNITNIASAAQSHKLSIGGNAALIAEFLSKFEHTNVHLYGPAGSKLRPLFSKRLVLHDAGASVTDEIHLIIEYKSGEKFSGLTAPIANRFIVHHDVANSQLVHASGFLKTANDPSQGLDWIVWSGLHFLDSLPTESYMAHILPLNAHLTSRKVLSPVHLELASMANADFVRALYQNVVVFVDSLGLNDQELMFLAKCIGGPELRANGPIDTMIEAMIWILKNAQQQVGENRHLQRIHMHSHRFHAIAISKNSNWYGSSESVLHGAFIAAVRACGGEAPDLFDLSKAKFANGTLLPHTGVGNPVISWSDSGNGIEVFVVPTILCRHPVGTVGLGDAISAAALLYTGLKSV